LTLKQRLGLLVLALALVAWVGWELLVEKRRPVTGQGNPEIVLRLDPNTATVEELSSLPGIGPKVAGAIVSYREEQAGKGRVAFTQASDLTNVRGIGKALAETLEPHLRLGAEATSRP
jgi:competence ComEA-like helix-hairpin-helix protein